MNGVKTLMVRKG